MLTRSLGRKRLADANGRCYLKLVSFFVSFIAASGAWLGACPVSAATAAPPEPIGCTDTAPGRTPVFVRPELERLISLFGTGGEEADQWISTYCLYFVEDNACLFFSVMSERPGAWERWLKELDRNSFEDRGGCSNLECFRQRAIGTLETVGLYELRNNAEFRAMLQRLLKRLKEIKVTHNPV